MGIEEILRKNDAKRAAQSGSVRNAVERAVHTRETFAETVARELLAALKKLKDPAIGEPERLPIAAKPSEAPIYFECEGMVRLTLHCVIRSDHTGAAFCSPIDLGLSRGGGKIVRGSLEPAVGHGTRANRLGVLEKHFGIDVNKLRTAIEALAHQL